MVHWLDSVTDLKVRLAQEDDRVEAGYVYVLPPEQHLIVKSDQRLAAIPRQDSDVYHPSCNLLLESVAEVFGEKAVGLIMTGMGSDVALNSFSSVEAERWRRMKKVLLFLV